MDKEKKNIHSDQNEKKDHEDLSHICSVIAGKIHNEIYPKGMESVLEKKQPPKDEPHIIYVFNCPRRFYEEYTAKYPIIHSKLKIKNAFQAITDNKIDEDLMKMIEDEYDFNADIKLDGPLDKTLTFSSFSEYITNNTIFYNKMILKTFEHLV